MREFRMPLIFGVKSNSTVRRLKAAASYFQAISHSDDTHPDVTAIAGKGVQSIGNIFATGGDNASDYDEDGNYTGANMHAYMADGDSGGSGKSATLWRKTIADAVAEPLGHAKSILTHEHANDFDKRCAAIVEKKLSSLTADDSESKNTNQLKAHLVSEFGLPADADETDVSKKAAELLLSGELSHEQYMDLISPQEHHAKGNENNDKDQKTMKTERPSLGKTFGGTGDVNVKAPSAMYCSKRYEAKNKRGEVVYRNDKEAITLPSKLEHAKMGVIWLDLARRKGLPGARELTEHEHQLLLEVKNEDLWCGQYAGVDYGPTKLATIIGRKGTDLIADSTSGGENLVPYFYDVDLYTFPLLYGELYPMVQVTELGISNQVLLPRMENVDASWSSTEGSGNAIPLQTTDSLVDKLTSNVYNVAFSITVGRDMLADSPVKLGSYIGGLFSKKLMHELDRVIAKGSNSSKEPLGLANTSGANTVTSQNNSAGPYLVTDLENMLSSLPKQYRTKNDPVCWVMADSSWFRMRGMKTGLSGDQRRVLGYDYEGYRLFNRDVKIQNDISGSDIMLANMSLYRMWRRLGLQVETSTVGKTLMLDNEALWVGRARFAGQFIDGAGLSLMTTAPLH